MNAKAVDIKDIPLVTDARRRSSLVPRVLISPKM